MNLFKYIFGQKEEVDLKKIINSGAMVVDVREPDEFQGEHLQNAVNIPLNTVENNLAKFGDKKGNIVVYCRSGGRASMAKMILDRNGFEHVYNGGGLNILQNMLK